FRAAFPASRPVAFGTGASPLTAAGPSRICTGFPFRSPVSARAYHRPVAAAAVDLDCVLGDTRPLWEAWLEDVARRLRLGPLDLPSDRAAAAIELDARVGNWPVLLERFAEDRAPIFLRPDAETSAALRRLQAAGVRLGVFTDAPEPLARVAAAQLGAAR